MAKMKVHELAKELEIQSKEIITYLKEKGMEVKAAQSSIEDEAIALVEGTSKQEEKSPERRQRKLPPQRRCRWKGKQYRIHLLRKKQRWKKKTRRKKQVRGRVRLKRGPHRKMQSRRRCPERRRRSSSSIIPATAKCRETETATEMRTEAAETEGPRGSRDALRDRTVLRGTAQGRYPRRIPTGL